MTECLNLLLKNAIGLCLESVVTPLSFALFSAKEHPLTVEVIYKVSVEIILKETERQLDASSNDISHVGFTKKWCETKQCDNL